MQRWSLFSPLPTRMAVWQALIAAKAQVKHGEWQPWLAENFDASERTARVYMALAKRQHAAVLEGQSLREALRGISPATEDTEPDVDLIGDDHSTKPKPKKKKPKKKKPHEQTITGKPSVTDDLAVVDEVRDRFEGCCAMRSSPPARPVRMAAVRVAGGPGASARSARAAASSAT
jgi:hypothetical protein